MKIRFDICNSSLEYAGDDPETLEQAWDITLAKWEFIRNHFKKIIFCGGTNTCGLCLLYNRWKWDLQSRRWVWIGGTDSAKGKCLLCPIHKHTGKIGCLGTPYIDCQIALKDQPYVHDNVALLKQLIEKEIAFLKKVRAEGETTDAG